MWTVSFREGTFDHAMARNSWDHISSRHWGWTLRRKLGIYLHWPPLTQHVQLYSHTIQNIQIKDLSRYTIQIKDLSIDSIGSHTWILQDIRCLWRWSIPVFTYKPRWHPGCELRCTGAGTSPDSGEAEVQRGPWKVSILKRKLNMPTVKLQGCITMYCIIII